MEGTAWHPMQPIVKADDGVYRFKANGLVRFLLDWATPRGIGLNELAMMRFAAEDHEQLAQLIGYSVSGFGDLSYASEARVAVADRIVEKMIAREGNSV